MVKASRKHRTSKIPRTSRTTRTSRASKAKRPRSGTRAPKTRGDFSKALRIQDKKILTLSKRLDDVVKKEAAILNALGLPKKPKGRERSRIEELQESIINLEEYLLNTASRIDNILKALKTHREFLMRINRRVYKADAKGRIKMELDIMKNTLSILTMNGIDFDSTILKDIDKLKVSLDDDQIGISELKRRKERLDQKFNVELKRFDLESIYNKRKILPGYV